MSHATLHAIYGDAARKDGSMTIKEFRVLWQQLNLPFLPDHSVNLKRAFKLIDVDDQDVFHLAGFLDNLKPLLEFVESKKTASRLRASQQTCLLCVTDRGPPLSLPTKFAQG
jgi:hypothetical protein